MVLETQKHRLMMMVQKKGDAEREFTKSVKMAAS